MSSRLPHVQSALAIGAAVCLASVSMLAGAATVDVRIENYAYVPATVTVRVGDTVRWVNAEKRTSHSILFVGPGGSESDRLFAGETYERRFDRAGRYVYTCGPHPEMRGVVIVE